MINAPVGYPARFLALAAASRTSLIHSDLSFPALVVVASISPTSDSSGRRYQIPEPNSPFRDKPAEKSFGPVKVTEKEALAVVVKAISQLGYSAKIPELRKRPEIVPPRQHGTNYLARHFINW